MKRIADWRAPSGACGDFQALGDALVFPVIRELEVGEDEEAKTTEFGLWSINLLSHEERFIKAPFYAHSELYWAEDFEWHAASQKGGVVVMTLSYQRSYDYAYEFFIFDGETWREVDVEPDPKRQEIQLWEEELKVWDEAGPLSLEHPTLSGGALAAAGKPLTFSVDFTHAFSYDSGPLTPSASEYERTLKRSGRNPAPGVRFGPIELTPHPALKACLPPYHRAHTKSVNWLTLVERKKKLIIIDKDHEDTLQSVCIIDPS